MEKLNRRIETLSQALETLKKSINIHQRYSPEQEDLFLATRDSAIQRFEYCTDLLWKLFKTFLEDFEKITLVSASPRNIVRNAVADRIISESEGEVCMDMIQKRNETSHLYHEEVAADIMQHIPEFYNVMKLVLERIQERSS